VELVVISLMFSLGRLHYEDRAGRLEPVECFLATVPSSPEARFDVYRALKTFFRFMSSRRRLPNPMDAIQSPRRPKTLMPTLEVGELMMLLHSTESPRDKAIITLLVDCGVRAGEVHNSLGDLGCPADQIACRP